MKTRTLGKIVSLGVFALVSVLICVGCSSSGRYDRSATRHDYREESPAFAGRITEIDRRDNTITVRSEDLTRSFALADDAVVVDRDNNQRADLRDLQTGDRVI